MTDYAINVENIGKRYLIGELEKYYTFRDKLGGMFSSNGSSKSKEKEYVWALKDISFNVNRGEVIGLIGRNGAGKSTLLKVLSRITSPTEGKAVINGRVGSLLEVGTGFHPELTGRENIYLNGSILGMSKKEISNKFDEIVDFAEVEKFLDTPVKRYSSGMHVRLAFSVAAHLEPEILLVDEVLSVGDYDFQMKCLGKMDNVSKGGRTVIFVSHNLAMVESLCSRSLLLENGGLKADGPTNDITDQYLNNSKKYSTDKVNYNNSKDLYFTKFSLNDSSNDQITWVNEEEGFYINFEFIVTKEIKSIELGFQCYPENSRNPLISTTITDDPSYSNDILKPGTYSAQLFIEGDKLQPGSYFFSFFAHDPNKEVYDLQNSVLRLNIKHKSDKNLSKYYDNKLGLIKINNKWSINKSD